jgi:hypothetical protein
MGQVLGGNLSTERIQNYTDKTEGHVLLNKTSKNIYVNMSPKTLPSWVYSPVTDTAQSECQWNSL